MFGYVAKVHIYFWIYLVYSKQGEACKDNIAHGKTPSRLTLGKVRLHSVLVTFGFSENVIVDSAQC